MLHQHAEDRYYRQKLLKLAAGGCVPFDRTKMLDDGSGNHLAGGSGRFSILGMVLLRVTDKRGCSPFKVLLAFLI